MRKQVPPVGQPAVDDERVVRRRKRWGIALAAASCALVGLLLSPPATAEPPTPSVPDEGARPPVTGGVAGTGITPDLTGQPAAAAPVLGPLAQQIRTEITAVQALAERLKQVEAEVAQISADVETKRKASESADAEVVRLRESAGSEATEAYKASRALGPLGDYARDLQKLSRVAPALGPRPGGVTAARELARAEENAQNAGQAYRAARSAETVVVGRRDAAKLEYDQRVNALTALRTRNSKELAKAEAEAEAYERSIGIRLNVGAGPDGWAPHPDVEKVLNYALSKRGKPYLFGAEGPNAYDCSGLMWDSYRQVGVRLPRIANEQYNATTKINRTDLLPGDLVFFGPPGSWINIGHVGMYLGGGQMIQAPTSGDVVRVSGVTWSRFYGATRPLPARRVTPPPTTPPASSKSPSPSPSTSKPSSPPPSSPSSPPPSSPPSSPPANGGGGQNGGGQTSPSRSPSPAVGNGTDRSPSASQSARP